MAGDTRLPHLASKISNQIHKTALGAESLIPFEYYEELPLEMLRAAGYEVVGLEQDARAHDLRTYSPPLKTALLLGEEVAGIDAEIRAECDELIEIRMYGKKESFNVSVAAGIALYGLTANS